MPQNQEVALFVDFDNIRYGFLNTYDCEPEPLELMEAVQEYGRVVAATAYADFTEHPTHFRRSMEVAGIFPRDVPKRKTGSPKSSAAMVMLMDIIDCLLDRPDVETYVVMTGNSDFMRVVARARHRFGKRVVIAGVPGTISQDLIDSADEQIPVVSEAAVSRAKKWEEGRSSEAFDGVGQAEVKLVRLIDYLERNRPYLTFNFIYSYAVNPEGQVRLSEQLTTRLLDEFIEKGLLIPYEKRLDDGRTVVNVRLNYDHPVSQRVVGQAA